MPVLLWWLMAQAQAVTALSEGPSAVIVGTGPVSSTGAPPPSLAASQPAYVLAGDKVEATYKAYGEDLKAFYSALRKRIQTVAPELLKKLSPEPPKLVEPGYQYLPKIAETPLEATRPKDNFTTNVFSWVNTGNWLETEKKSLKEYQQTLRIAGKKELDELIPKYQALDANQKIINSQIQYNRLWQGEIAAYPGRYNLATKKYDDLVAGKLSPEAVVADTLAQLMATPGPAVKWREVAANHIVIDVEMVTDIDDAAYVASLKKAVEKFWHVKAEVEYEVNLTIRPLKVQELYGKEQAPKKGDKVDMAKHITHFPVGPVILTTGAGTLHYSFLEGHPYVVLGTLDLNEVLIAHEFGHLLQLNDAYFRGYRDIGESGYQVLEVVPDMTDIMSAPGVGRVKRHHFEIVVKALKERDKKAAAPPDSV